MNTPDHPQFLINVVVVSDYEASEEKSWKDERKILQALADQDIDKPFQVILVENNSARNSVPNELTQIYPHVAIVFADSGQSAKLKDEGIKHAQTEYVAVLEADCLPNREWLRALYEALCQHNDFSIASGRTTYGDETMYKRCLSVLDRSFDNLGRPGETTNVSNNGALYRLPVLKKFPYPEAVTPFQSARMRINIMHENGIKFYFEPKAVMRHAIGGFNFIRDFRRNTGYADMMEHPRKTIAEIPKLLFKRLKSECADCLRLGPICLKWYDWPLLMLILLVVPFLQIPGMIDAVKQRKAIPHSSYR